MHLKEPLMKRLIAIGAIAATGLLAVPPTTAAADETTPTALEQSSAYVQPSIVYMRMDWTGYVWDSTNRQYLNNEEPFQISTQCTGFIVNPSGYIASAGHCVDRKGAEIMALFTQYGAQWAIDNAYYADSSLTVEDIIGFGSYTVAGTQSRNMPDLAITVAWEQTAGGVDTANAQAARVVKAQPFTQGDGALLKVEATDLPAIPLADSAELEVGTEVVSVGYPVSVDEVTDANLTPSFKEGTISSMKTIDGGLSQVYEMSAALSGGMSGGPTVNLDGEVVGFNSYNNSGETQQFNFLRPASTISELMADAGVDNELGEISTNYRAGLDAYFAEDKAVAVEKLQAVVDDQPTNVMAQEYLSKAKDLPDPAPAAESSSDGGGFPIMWAGIGGGVLLLIGAGAVLMMRKRGGSTTPPAGGQPVPAGGAQTMPPVAAPATFSAPPPPVVAPAPPPVTVTSPPAPATAPSAQPSAPSVPTPVATATAPVIPPQPSAPEPTLGFTAPAPVEVEAPASAEAQQEAVFCTECGTRAKPGQRFCGGCGSSLG